MPQARSHRKHIHSEPAMPPQTFRRTRRTVTVDVSTISCDVSLIRRRRVTRCASKTTPVASHAISLVTRCMMAVSRVPSASCRCSRCSQADSAILTPRRPLSLAPTPTMQSLTSPTSGDADKASRTTWSDDNGKSHPLRDLLHLPSNPRNKAFTGKVSPVTAKLCPSSVATTSSTARALSSKSTPEMARNTSTTSAFFSALKAQAFRVASHLPPCSLRQSFTSKVSPATRRPHS
mmetsp:Transcript_29325/g.84273  ORF Transcript_29325/g.84273 Transcript_29325/m.84273 type:complete len:234 (-) Transcript_29325:176-877(-)